MLKVTFLLQNMFNNRCLLSNRSTLSKERLYCTSLFFSKVLKIGTDNFRIGGANLQLGSGDGGVSLWTSGWQDCLVSLN